MQADWLVAQADWLVAQEGSLAEREGWLVVLVGSSAEQVDC